MTGLWVTAGVVSSGIANTDWKLDSQDTRDVPALDKTTLTAGDVSAYRILRLQLMTAIALVTQIWTAEHGKEVR